MSIGTWFAAEETKIAAFFTDEEKLVVEFFEPLIKSIVAAGGQVVLDSAMAAAKAAEGAPSGTRVQAAEAAFLTTSAGEGMTVVANAQAGAIKAAVAVLQATIPTNEDQVVS